jgi:hypothetical protein
MTTEMVPIASPDTKDSSESFYMTEQMYFANRNKILQIEGQICNGLSFDNHVALPHPLAITYLQTLDGFTNRELGHKVAAQTIRYLNTALISPQMLYLTHQPNALAVGAIYLAARDCGMKLPEVEWWEVFDVDREELGFLVVAFGSTKPIAQREIERWGKQMNMMTIKEVRAMAKEMGVMFGGEGLSEEAEMARLLDEKVAAQS